MLLTMGMLDSRRSHCLSHHWPKILARDQQQGHHHQHAQAGRVAQALDGGAGGFWQHRLRARQQPAKHVVQQPQHRVEHPHRDSQGQPNEQAGNDVFLHKGPCRRVAGNAFGVRERRSRPRAARTPIVSGKRSHRRNQPPGQRSQRCHCRRYRTTTRRKRARPVHCPQTQHQQHPPPGPTCHRP